MNRFLPAAFVLGLLSVSQVAAAETFTCSFTEPFLSLTYSTKTQKLKRKSAATGKRVTQGVTFHIKAPGTFVLNRKGNKVATLELTFKGSDGMGSTVYPYEIKLEDATGANNGRGGCASSLLKAKEGKE